MHADWVGQGGSTLSSAEWLISNPWTPHEESLRGISRLIAILLLDWFADRPVKRYAVPNSRPLLMPDSSGPTSWLLLHADSQYRDKLVRPALVGTRRVVRPARSCGKTSSRRCRLVPKPGQARRNSTCLTEPSWHAVI
jgi:hypothetical protein